MYFVQDEVISWKSTLLKFVDEFKYVGSNFSFTEIDINIRIDEVSTALERLWTIRQLDLFDKAKRWSFPAVAVSLVLYGSTAWI